jgi:hypothetical protein
MARRFVLAAPVLTALALGLAACGGGGSESDKKSAEGGTVKCEGSSVSNTGLPSSFPDVDGVTFTKTSKAGPSQVVDGYYEGELRDAYDSYKSAFDSAGYKILFDEIEDHDSEISYDGGGRTGQVALREDCEESGRIAVHVTSRPE